MRHSSNGGSLLNKTPLMVFVNTTTTSRLFAGRPTGR
uniref:Uncharacterized protein n=1 Tax=Steinernema glaseri TaxID=37863 RepID=A0A1I7Z0W5_9BILA